jgi:DNA-binding transcriptional LysR family regulator
MNLHQLRAFAVVAEEGSMTAAARRLRATQPAISKQLSELEDVLGITLFDRLPRGVRLTEAGAVLHRHAARIFAAEAAAERELSELRGLSRGTLSIGASTTIGNYVIPSLLGTFNQAHPHVRLALEIGNTAAIQSMVVDDRVDFGLTEGFVASEQLVVEVFFEDEMVAIVSPDHPLSRRGASLSLADLSRRAFICREHGSGTRDVIEAALAERGITLEPVMALGSTEAVKKAVAAGVGIAIVSRLAVELELSAGRVAVLPVSDLEIRRSLHLVQLRGKRPSPATAAFLALMKQTLAAPAAR